MGLFGRLTTTDDTEELIHLKNGVEAVQRSGDLQVRMRGSHLAEVEQDVNNKRRELHQTKDKLKTTEEKLQQVEAENEKLREQQEALRQTAINIAIDRKAIFNTIEYLNQKWGRNAPKSPETQQLEQQGVIILDEEAEQIRKEEVGKMINDETTVKNIAQRVDLSAHQKIVRKRRPKN